MPPYPGQTTIPDTWPYAGIEFHNVIALNLPKFSGNIFQQLSIGIIAEQTNLTIQQGATFKNLRTVSSYDPYSNTGILMQSSTNPYQLIKNGFGGAPTSPIAFENCLTGILTIGNINFEIVNNRIETNIAVSQTVTPVGMICLGSRGRTGWIANNRIQTNQAGIILAQNDDPNTNLTVVNNEITISNGSFLGGIALFEGGITYTPVIEDNTINMYDARTGILCSNQSGALIKGNQINLLNDVPNPFLGLVGYPNRTGIYTGGGTNQTFSCNTIQGGAPGTAAPFPAYDFSPIGINNENTNVFGISAWQSTGNAYECNQFDLIPNGLQLSGMPSTSDVKGNVFNRVARGLWLTNGSQIGQQSHTGNRWTWSALAPLTGLSQGQINAMGVAGAQNDAGSFNVLQNSIFLFDAGANVDFEPFSKKRIFPNIPNLWFVPLSSGGTSFDCNNSNTCTLPVPLANINGGTGGNISILSNVDESVVQDTLQPTLFPQTTLFEANKATYTKLKEDPILSPTGSAAAAFVQQQAQECEGEMYDIEVQYCDLNVLSQSIQGQVDQRQQQIETGLTEVYRLDSLSLVDTLDQDSLQGLAMLERQAIKSIVEQQAQLFAQQEQLRTTSADVIATQNTGITVQYTAEENLQDVHEIYLATIAKGIFEFDVDQIQSLDLIARQCPLEGGIAVYKARSMVTFFTKVNYVALQACGTTENIARIEKVLADVDILDLFLPKEAKIYPNPANKEITIEWEQKADQKANRTVLIVNSLGQKIYQGQLNERIRTINTEKWASGFYTCQFIEGASIIHTKKIIIVKP